MDKRIKNVVTETQQEIRTKIERKEGKLTVEVRACSKLDDELRSAFHEEVRALDSEAISVMSKTYKSNQGNETGQDVTVTFDSDDTLQALEKINTAIQIGKEYCERQLERNLGNEEDGASDWQQATQQRYFEDDEIKEFCLLFRGRVEV